MKERGLPEKPATQHDQHAKGDVKPGQGHIVIAGVLSTIIMVVLHFWGLG